MAKPKMTKDTVPEDFTLPLVLVDALPVLFFCGSMVLISLLFRSPLFLVGALLCLFAGVCKVLWKLIVVLKKKNIWWMFLQMRICMLPGFLLMLLSVFLRRDTVSLSGIWAAVTAAPQCFFFGAGAAGMALMLVFGFTLDSGSVKANWIEQLTNGLAQLCIFAGLLIQVL